MLQGSILANLKLWYSPGLAVLAKSRKQHDSDVGSDLASGKGLEDLTDLTRTWANCYLIAE